MNLTKLLREGIILNSINRFSQLLISFFLIILLSSAYLVFCKIQLSNLSESFEDVNFPPSGWTKVNVAFGSTGWERHTAGEHPVPGFNYGDITVPPGGGNAVAFCNYITGGTGSNDEWLITPQLTNIQSNDSLIFWMRKFGIFSDHMDIKISTTDPLPAAMTIPVAALNFNPTDTGWVYYRYRIGSLVTPGASIYLGFRQWVISTTNQGSSFSLDLVRKTGPAGIKNINLSVLKTTKLEQNYPNPFNPVTTINYEIVAFTHVKLSIFNINGDEVAILVNESREKGFYNVTWDAENFSSGVYFCKLTTGQLSDVKKMLLLK